MESISLIFGIIILVFAALQIILFFKLWGMTDHIADINKEVNYIAKSTIFQNKDMPAQNSNAFDVGSLVVCRATEKQMRISSIDEDGTYECTIAGQIVGSFKRDELYIWDEWLKKLKK